MISMYMLPDHRFRNAVLPYVREYIVFSFRSSPSLPNSAAGNAQRPRMRSPDCAAPYERNGRTNAVY